MLPCSKAMNSRELTLVSAAAVIGSFASALTIHLFFNPKRRSVIDPDSGVNSLHQRNSSSKNPFDPSKRQGYLSWDDYFMAIAFLSAERSKDPNRQVGACLVSQNYVILGIGYNGFPRGCSDDKLPWAKKSKNGDPLETKYPLVFPRLFILWRRDWMVATYVASHKLMSMAGIKVRRHQPQMKEISIKFDELYTPR